GVLLTAWGAGMVGGSLAFTALARARLSLLGAGAALAVAAGYAIMGVAPSLAVAAAAATLGGAGNGMQWVAFASRVQERAPLDLAPLLAAVLESMTALAPGVGFLAGGVAVSLLDPRVCLVGIGVAIAAVVALSSAQRAAAPGRRPGPTARFAAPSAAPSPDAAPTRPPW
ncbi:MAG: hypothetical protein QOF37_458, partial [Thermoleophilaceae bacterium]|nr:hypothetical protein [Thermoleophilaceae bacterium]